MKQHQPRTAFRYLLLVKIIFFSGTGCLFLAMMCSNCGVFMLPVSAPAAVVTRKVEEGVERRKGPMPESEWNRNGIWYRVSNHPLTYLPKGYGRNLPRTDQTGTWIVDERDGKRFFVPNGGADDISDRVLLADAKSATNWQYRPSLRITPESLISGQVEGN